MNAKGEHPLPSFLFDWFALYTGHGQCDCKSNRRAFRYSGCFCFFERSVVSVQVIVRDNNVDQALKALKKKMQREGIFREMKLRRHFEKPSEKKAREGAEAIRRARKLERKRIEREGF
jgi:small subunit ribosomal protein S21